MIRTAPALLALALSACASRPPEWLRADLATAKALHAVHGASAHDVWAVGDSGLALHYDGTAWTTVDSAVPGALNAVWAAASNDVWMVGEAGTVLRWNGLRLVKVASPTSSTLKSVWGLGPRDVWLSTGSSTWWFDGTGYAEVKSSYSFGIDDVGGTPATGLWIISSGKLYSGAAGAVAPVDVGTTDSWNLVVPTSATSLWVVSSQSYSADKALRLTGGRWTPVDLPKNGTDGFALHAGFGAGDETWFVGDQSTILHVTGSAAQVESTGGLGAQRLERVWGASWDDVWAVGGGGVLLRRAVLTTP